MSNANNWEQADATRTASVIVRFPDLDRIADLDRALFSLATQSRAGIQVIVAVQNGHLDQLRDIKTIIEKQPFFIDRVVEVIPEYSDNPASPVMHTDAFKHRVIAVAVAEGAYGRSILFNEGLKAADGRYLAFLDYDDLMYPHAYDVLIDRLHVSGAAVAVGGCRIARLRYVGPDRPHFTTNKTPQVIGSTPLLRTIAGHVVPIHSVVVDTDRVRKEDLVFDTNVTCYEDYLFLLRLAGKYRFDFEALSQPIAEYRLKDDDSDTKMLEILCPPREKNRRDTTEYVEAAKKGMIVGVDAAELTALVIERDELKRERDEAVARLQELLGAGERDRPENS